MHSDEHEHGQIQTPLDSGFSLSPLYFAGEHHHELTVQQYYDGVRARDFKILARALTLVESSAPRHQDLAEQVLNQLLPYTNNAARIGITGVPGVGKSTFIEALGMQLVAAGKRLAVLAVDPTSTVSGGSILGDKTRMMHLAAHANAFIRPSPSAGTPGGVARKTRESMLVCEAAGYDVVIIETVGVGQSETMVANITDCFVALMLPGGGDELQAIKRGLLELVDVVAVNKADGANLAAAELAAHQLSMMFKSMAGNEGYPPDVLTCSALNNQGIDKVWDKIEKRCTRMRASGELAGRRREQNLRWLWSSVDDRLRQALRTHPAVHAIRGELEAKVLRGEMTPEAAARQVFDAFGLKW